MSDKLLAEIQKLLPQSRVLDAPSKKAYENALPHMNEDRRKELLAVLREELNAPKAAKK